jgi:hypothetical protein
MSHVDRFAIEVAAFEDWLLRGTDEGADAGRAALVRLLALYSIGIQLPPEWSDELEDAADAEELADSEWRKAHEATRRLPFDFYSTVLNPMVVPDAEVGIGSLADDLADIYRDVATGLREYERGEVSKAIWEWSFGLHSHWGEHACGAIRALHGWLAANAQDHLSAHRDAAG